MPRPVISSGKIPDGTSSDRIAINVTLAISIKIGH